MKRILKITTVTFFACLITMTALKAQEKKNEQHIKIVVVDKLGTKIELDTIIKDSPLTDSIKLKNGEVFYLRKHGSAGTIKHIHGDGKNDGNVIIIRRGARYFGEGSGGKVMSWSSAEGDSKGRIIYINEGTEGLKDGEKTFDVKVKTNKSGETIEKTKYVLAKDGMVISVEGNDEAKVKDLVKDIETKLDVNKEGTTTKPVVKEDTKKSIKK